MDNANVRVAFVGAGAMGGAVARGIFSTGKLAASQLAIAEVSAGIRASFSELGIAAYADAAEMIAAFDPDAVILAVKPQVAAAVLEPVAGLLGGRLTVSIMAGVPLSKLYGLCASERVIRLMPNLPVAAGLGAIALAQGAAATAEDVALVEDLLADLAVVKPMREDQLDVAGVVSGSSPAFFAFFVDCLTRAGIEAGLPAADCREMVEATMRGTAQQLLDSGEHPRTYMERVSSPGGTTIAALRAMEGDVFRAITDAVDAALERTRELSEN